MTNPNKKEIFFKFDNFEFEAKQFSIETYSDIGFMREKLRNLPVGSKSGRLPGLDLGFNFSQVVESIIYYIEKNAKKYPDTEKLTFQHINIENENPYIIAIAVQYAPCDWTDLDNLGNPIKLKKSIFELLNHRYKEDLQNGKAILLIDQSVEGYSTPWLWEWFHKKCYLHKINPMNIIYLTGDQMCADSYDAWCKDHSPHNKLKVIPSVSLSIFVHKHCHRNNVFSNFDELLKYKKENKEKIYLYDCLNRRARKQRIFNFLHLLNAGLINDGNITMSHHSEWKEWADFNDPTHTRLLLKENGFLEKKLGVSQGLEAINLVKNSDILPKVANYNYDLDLKHYYHWVERVVTDLYKHSWLSLVVESSFYAYESNVFISEKTFKPIAAMQPFIIVGSQNALKYLRKLGYKTFHPYIDESYDDEPDHTRFKAIMESLKKIKAIEDKAAWYESIREIVEHNYNLFMKIGDIRSKEHEEVMNYYFDYCDQYKNR